MLITDYFRQIESTIAECVDIVEYTLTKDRRSLHIGIVEGELIFTDETVLHFVEFVNVKESTEVYKYSYQYQRKNGDLVFRYDMAPHHREIGTFPYHKHTGSNMVIEAPCPTLSQVLDEIDDIIGQTW